MDMMSIMMGNMPQSPVSGNNTAGAPLSVAAQGEGRPGSKSPFFQMLGTSMQSREPVFLAAEGVSPDPTAVMESLTATSSTVQPGNDDKGNSALSVMSLLNGLRAAASERKSGMDVAPPTADQLASLLSELQQMTDGTGSLTPELQESLRGLLNPAATRKEAQIAKLASGIDVDPSNEQNASEMVSALIASLNGLLRQTPGRSVPEDQHGNPGSGGPISDILPVGTQVQAKSGTADLALKTDQQNSDAEAISATVAGTPGLAEISGMDLSAQKPAETGLNPVNHPKLQSKTRLADAVALIDVKIQDNARNPATPEGLAANAGNPVSGEEQVNPELSEIAGQKESRAAGLKFDQFRMDMVNPSQPEARMQQLSELQPQTDARAAVSHEQIMSQIKEKLAEQRISSDNGQVTLRLHPAELGELKITVRMDEQRVRVDVVAENRMVKDALMQNVDSLKEALARQNVAMERFDVSTGGGRQLFDQGFREGRQQEQQHVSRGGAWLTGRSNDQSEAVATQWQAREDALLDMMM